MLSDLEFYILFITIIPLIAFIIILPYLIKAWLEIRDYRKELEKLKKRD